MSLEGNLSQRLQQAAETGNTDELSQILQQAAETGSIEELYAVIQVDPNILEKIDSVPFINTPLHVAAASGELQFAVEMLNLKPSFATKLNTSGYSPLHLAVDKNMKKFVSMMLRLDPGLARVKGKNGITPFLFLVSKGEADLVEECLMTCPECIQDESVNFESALHLAVMNDGFEVLQVLTGWIQRMSQKDAFWIENRVLNRIDFSSNTALHLAARKNDHQAMRLLLECRMVQRNRVNDDGLTFLDIMVREHGQRSVGGDSSSQIQRAVSGDLDLDEWRSEIHRAVGGDLHLEKLILETGCKMAHLMPRIMPRSEYWKSPITFWKFFFTGMRRFSTNYSEETRGAFLIVCTLIITATYQTALQPPGGVHQSGGANAGSVVMKQTFFILLWIFNTLGFFFAVLYSFCLLSSWFTNWFLWIVTSLCISYALAMAVISPHPLVFLPLTLAFMLLWACMFLLGLFGVPWRIYLAVPSLPLLISFWKD